MHSIIQLYSKYFHISLPMQNVLKYALYNIFYTFQYNMYLMSQQNTHFHTVCLCNLCVFVVFTHEIYVVHKNISERKAYIVL